MAVPMSAQLRPLAAVMALLNRLFSQSPAVSRMVMMPFFTAVPTAAQSMVWMDVHAALRPSNSRSPMVPRVDMMAVFSCVPSAAQSTACRPSQMDAASSGTRAASCPTPLISDVARLPKDSTAPLMMPGSASMATSSPSMRMLPTVLPMVVMSSAWKPSARASVTALHMAAAFFDMACAAGSSPFRIDRFAPSRALFRSS